MAGEERIFCECNVQCERFLLKWALFRGYVSFGEGTVPEVFISEWKPLKNGGKGGIQSYWDQVTFQGFPLAVKTSGG